MSIKLSILALFLCSQSLLAAGVQDTMLLDGGEQITSFGMDTTKNWWAITQPFAERYRLYVNEKKSDVYLKLSQPVFAPDGEHWAALAQNNTQWLLLTQDSILQTGIDINSQIGDIAFSPNSRVLAYSMRQQEEEIIRFGTRTIRTNYRKSGLFLNQSGSKIAFIVQRGERVALAVNAKDIADYDEIKPLGFFYDDSFIYAGSSGGQWHIYRNDKEISPAFSSVPEMKINLDGTVAAAICVTQNGKSLVCLFSDEYTEALTGHIYDISSHLVLHPRAPLAAYNAALNGSQFVVQGTVEYAGGNETGPPYYSYDGSELYYAGFDTEMFVSVNGKRMPLQSRLPVNARFAFQPGKNIVSYATSATLVIRSLEFDKISMGKMCDETVEARYNHRRGEFETLGRVTNRLYLLHGRI